MLLGKDMQTRNKVHEWNLMSSIWLIDTSLSGRAYDHRNSVAFAKMMTESVSRWIRHWRRCVSDGTS